MRINTGLQELTHPAAIARLTGYPVGQVRRVVSTRDIDVVCRIGRVPVLDASAAEEVIAELDRMTASRIPLRPELDMLSEGLL